MKIAKTIRTMQSANSLFFLFFGNPVSAEKCLSSSIVRGCVWTMLLIVGPFWNHEAKAQVNLPSAKADTFVHYNDRPIFLSSNAFFAPSKRLIAVKLTSFPGFHIRKATLSLTFAQPLDASDVVLAKVAGSQFMPENYNVQWFIDQGKLVVDIVCPFGHDLVPGDFLVIQLEEFVSGIAFINKVVAIDGIVITDDIDGFRTIWLAPAKWLEHSEQ